MALISTIAKATRGRIVPVRATIAMASLGWIIISTTPPPPSGGTARATQQNYNTGGRYNGEDLIRRIQQDDDDVFGIIKGFMQSWN